MKHVKVFENFNESEPTEQQKAFHELMVKIFKTLKDVEATLTDIAEGDISKFGDDFTVASIKDELTGLIENVKETELNISSMVDDE